MLLLFHIAFLIVIWILNMKCKFKCISFLICLAFPLYYYYKSILKLYQQWLAHCIMRASALENIAFWAGNPKNRHFYGVIASAFHCLVICIRVKLIPMSQPMYDLGVLKVVHFLKVFTLMLFTEFRGENWRFWRLEEWRTDDRTPLKGGPAVSHFCSSPVRNDASFGSNNNITTLPRFITLILPFCGLWDAAFCIWILIYLYFHFQKSYFDIDRFLNLTSKYIITP